MANSIYYAQECPTCGRMLQIRVAHLGKQLVCQHCRGKFTACDPASHRYPDCNEAEHLLHRADALLRDARSRVPLGRVHHPR